MLLQAWFSDLEAGFDQLHVSIFECIFNNSFVLIDRNRASRINDISSGFRVSVNAVDGSFDQLLLEMRKLSDILLCFLDLDGWISSNNSETGARGVEQAPIKLLENIWQLPSIIVGYDNI